MRTLLTTLLLATVTHLSAQLNLMGADAGARPMKVESPLANTADRYLNRLFPPVTPAPARRRPHGRSAISKSVDFDFTATRPHLAFFCRLEINEARGNRIPMKFRLGGVTAWQYRLLRDD